MKKLYISFGIGALIIIVACLFYFYMFDFTLSNDQAVWGQFGDYLSVFVAIASLVVISSLTYFIAKNENRRDDENKILENSKIRPILIFKDIGGKWACKNVGEGAALNIMIAYKTNNLHSWEHPVKIYSMTSKEEFQIEWKKFGVAKWVATYNDIRGEVFTSICEDDDTVYQIGRNELKIIGKTYMRLEDAKKISFD